MSRKIACVLFLIFIILLTGCWNARELNELGISLVMGLDIEDDKILVTLEVVDPSYAQKSSGGKEGGPVKYVQGVGNTIFEAFRDITLKFDRRIFTSHNKVIIFGEEFARRGLVSHTDQLFRDREQRETAYMLIAKGAKAYEVMGIDSGLEEIPGSYILRLVQNIRDNPKTVDVNIMGYLRDHYLGGRHTMAGVVEKIERKGINGEVSNSEDSKYELTVIGAAIFRDDILVGYLDGNDTKSLNFIRNNVTSGLITFPTLGGVTKEKGSDPHHRHLTSIILIKVKAKNDVELKDGNIGLKTKIKIKGSIGEVAGDINVYNEKELKMLEEACSNTTKTAISQTVRKVQREIGLDIFGFGHVFHRKYPEEYKKIKDHWDEIFSQADFQIEVETNLVGTGLINTPIFID
ncbi:Ger(x)C family spore germination protein [Tepidimicrobium xylanilyticum]|uniref:Ger(x)C family spore germination protein n=1 Tax=Tepidimicrobium xylanilyticum TaxID=1123352 RepID=UPI0026554D1B|nr:Ger(x)C family spore germination protein [Tepidimicrobium xylanilyticum]GMG96998.1 spore germination protein GerC [Tepidimicrobium xylanilyticum]